MRKKGDHTTTSSPSLITSDTPGPKLTSKSRPRALQLLLRPKNLLEGLRSEYVVDHYPFTIGRHPTNDIELPLEAISRYHARVELSNGEPRIVDLRSSNGTFVNGNRIQLAKLNDQDTLSFGSLEFAVIHQEPEPGAGRDSAGPHTPSSVHFIQQDEEPQTMFKAELPEDSICVSSIKEEITNEQQLKRARDRLTIFYKLQDVLRSTTDEEKLLARVLDLIFEVVPVDRGVILTRDEHDVSLFRPIVIKTRPGGKGGGIGISRTILQRSMRERLAILTRDAQADQRFNESESVLASKMHSVMCVPLISVRHVFGFLHLDTDDAIRAFTEEDLAFVANLGADVARHLHNLRMTSEKIHSERMAAIGQTITGMAHNIKNILVLTQGGIEMMEKRLHNRQYDTVEENWHIVRRGLDRINKTVQDMLDYSRARTTMKTRLDVNAMLEDLSQTFYEEMANRGVTCALELAPEVEPLMLDADSLEKALTNLIINALEVCPEGTGRIVLRTALDGDKNLRIEVEDNGSGISKEILPRIFVPFFTTKGSKGSGLGLPMTKKIVQEIGGKIEVRTQEGKGTIFGITILGNPESPKLEEL